VVTYDLNGCQVGNLTLRSQVLSLILMGKITSWNDPLLRQDNPGLASCNLPILVAHDIGVTSSILKDYLSKRNSQWTAYRAPQLSQAWPGSSPVSCTANGTRPMALCVAGRPGTLGYGFYRDIVDAGLPIAQVDGPAGAWDNKNSILDGCTAAAGDKNAPNPFALMPPTASGDWGNTSLTDTAQPGAYPICSFDFIVAATGCRYSHSIVNYHALAAFLESVLSDYTQTQLPSHRFAQLPPSLQAFSTAGAKLLTCP
jgi:ABC-type phosphate transport system substrate-binding protein